jgi:hypothetical protein
MGTDIMKCQCACNKEDQLTANLENEHATNNNNDNKTPSLFNQISPLDSKNNKQYNSNSNITQSNGLNASPQQDLRNYVDVKSKSYLNNNTNNNNNYNYQNMNDLVTPSFMPAYYYNKQFHPYNNNNNINYNYYFLNINPNSIEHINAIILIQTTFKAYNYRTHYYPSIKATLILDTEQLYKSLRDEYETPNTKNAERNYKNEYSKKGWKQFYEDKHNINIDNLSSTIKDILSYNYGFVVHTKLYHIPNESIYSGQTRINNTKHGYGVLIKNDGSKYEGYWRDNVFTGWGRIIDIEGNLTEGVFVDAILNGKGIKASLNGNIYIGDFVNNVREGKGKEITNEHVYEGEFKDDKKNGKGKLVYKLIKDTYVGEFVDNAITGSGYYVWGNKDSYKGTFVNGKMHGKGLYKWPNGGEYYGDYVNNIKEGFGIFRWNNGKTYEGEFKNGKPNGMGKLKTHKREMEVEFKDGKLISNVQDLERLNTHLHD